MSRIQAELATAAAKERETVQALRDSEDVLAKRRNEIARMRDQVRREYLDSLECYFVFVFRFGLNLKYLCFLSTDSDVTEEVIGC